jgi:hypothetical protein
MFSWISNALGIVLLLALCALILLGMIQEHISEGEFFILVFLVLILRLLLDINSRLKNKAD